MAFTAYHSVYLLIFAVVVVFAGVTVSRLLSRSNSYNARLFTFGYFSLFAWILWIFQYAILVGAPFLSVPSGFFLTADLGLGIIQNAVWASAVLSLRFKQFSRKLLTLSLLGIVSVVIAFVTYQTITSNRFTQVEVVSAKKIFGAVLTLTIFDAAAAATIFIVLGIWIVQLRLSKISAAVFLIHGYSQWIWRWLWLTPLGMTNMAQLIFPLWRIALLVAWIGLISEMRQRTQPWPQKFGSSIERQKLPNLLGTLKVMISSTVEDLGPEREAADRAIRRLHLTRFRAETFGSVPHSPKVICALLAEQCDIFVLIIGKRHGYVIESEGISVVEFEYRVARAQNPQKILVYVKDGVDREPRLTEFLKRVQDFEHGYFRSSFTTPEDLHDKIQRDIARWLASQVKQNR
jgi:hypothetical protein